MRRRRTWCGRSATDVEKAAWDCQLLEEYVSIYLWYLIIYLLNKCKINSSEIKIVTMFHAFFCLPRSPRCVFYRAIGFLDFLNLTRKLKIFYFLHIGMLIEAKDVYKGSLSIAYLFVSINYSVLGCLKIFNRHLNSVLYSTSYCTFVWLLIILFIISVVLDLVQIFANITREVTSVQLK